jgi:hypothetical protein
MKDRFSMVIAKKVVVPVTVFVSSFLKKDYFHAMKVFVDPG